MKLFTQTLLLLLSGFISVHVNAQMRVVFNNNPYINISSSAYFVIDNANANAITSPTVGNIITENEFNVVKWNIGNATGNYIVPFTTSTLVKIPLALNILTAGNTATGSVIFSTYRTPTNTNLPYPSDVTNMNSTCNSNNALYAVDRFWRIDAINYSTKPSPVISFIYNNAVNEVGGTNTIIQSKLQAQRFNAGTNSWETPLKLYGQCNPLLSNVFNSSITPADFFKSWTLIDSSIMLVSKTRTVNICAGQSYFLQGSNQTTSGTFYDTLNVFSKCDTSYVTNLIVNPLPSGITLSTNSLSITCSNPTPSVTVTSTTSPVSYSWIPATGISSGAGTASPSFSLDGTYSVVVTNTLTGCASTVTTVVSTNTTLPSPSAVSNSTITCSTTSISLSSTPTGTNYAYLWTGPGTILNGTTYNPTVDAGGDYTLTITDNVNGCTNTTTVNAPTNTTVPTMTLTPSSLTTTCASPNVTLTTTSSTDPDASYTWTAPVTGTLNNTATSNPIAGGYGTFTVQVTNTITGCLSAIQTVSITADSDIPVLNATSTQSVICSSQTTTLSITGADTYTWSTLETASSITVTPTTTTTYTVSGTNTLTGCSNITNVTVNVTPTPTVNVAATAMTICEGNTTTLTLTGATNYTVTNPTQATTNTIILTPTVQTTYTVIGEASNCSSVSQTITIDVNTLPQIVTSNTATCSGNPVVLIATGAGTYSWSTTSTTNTTTVSPTNNTTYTVSGTNTLTGCSNIANVMVNVTPTPSVNVAATAMTICEGNTTTLTLTGATNYTITNPSQTTTNTIVLTPTVQTTYTVIGEASNCSSVTQTITINVNTLPQIVTSNTVTCSGNPVVLTATGADTYSWSTTSTTNTTTVSPTTNTTYTVTGTNTLTGCTSTITTADVTVNQLPTVTASANPNTTCTTGTVNLTANTTATNYTWTTGNGVTTTNQNQGTITFPASTLTTGTYTYTVMVTDVNGCVSAQATTTLDIINVPNTNFDLSDLSICQNDNGTISINTPQSGVTYDWNINGQTITNTNPLTLPNTVTGTVGIYTVNVIAGIGTCTNTAANIFTVNALPTVALVNPFVSECENTSAQLDIAGSNTTYNYIWTNGLNTATGTSLNVNSLTQATAGAYTVTATDLNGCQNRTIGNVVAEECITMVPEIFTPNGDGKNDGFEIKNIDLYPNNNLKIFNRWGNLIYQKNGYLNEFEGYANTGDQVGKNKLPSGTYFVILEYGDEKTETYNGFLLIQY